MFIKNFELTFPFKSSSLQVTTQDEGIIDFQPGFDNAAQSAIVTGTAPGFKILLTPVTRGGG